MITFISFLGFTFFIKKIKNVNIVLYHILSLKNNKKKKKIESEALFFPIFPKISTHCSITFTPVNFQTF